MIFPLSGTIYISPAVASWVLLKKIYEIKIRQCDDIDGCGGVWEGGPRMRGDICVYIYIYIYIHICNRICCTEETNTALHSDYTPIKNKLY